MFVRSTDQGVDRENFADRLASALNYSVAAAEIRVDLQLLPDVCLSERSVRDTFELILATSLVPHESFTTPP